MNISGTINAFQYLGGKYSVLPWLLPLLPECYSFVDVFGGSAAVIMNRRPSPIETYNDINGNVVNFFRMLRDRPEDLIKRIELTPHSRGEYQSSWYDPSDDELERARKFFVRNRQSFLSSGSQNKSKGWLVTTNASRANMSEATSKWLGSISGLMECTRRLRTIQIENRSWEWIIDTYDQKEALFYCDPPYDHEHRSGKNDYDHDFTSEDHQKLSDKLHSISGMAAVSGYDSEIMRSLYSDWYFHKGPERRNNFSKKQGIHECLWTNYDPQKFQYKLFD